MIPPHMDGLYKRLRANPIQHQQPAILSSRFAILREHLPLLRPVPSELFLGMKTLVLLSYPLSLVFHLPPLPVFDASEC